MKLSLSTLTLEGTRPEGENPLPMFRSRNPHREVAEDGSFTPELRAHFGEETGDRYLPYRIQDRYTRQRRPINVKTIVLENERLKATFLPEYGGRLYALVDKRSGRDVLYRNPVLQPANLAILNAWFSGGIEWNIGHLGHTFTTCAPVHAAKLTDPDGHAFLRIYEYERCKNVFWSIDFHLPPGAEQLQVHVRIVNDYPAPVPMYWWTNVAVEETEKARVFSSTDESVYISPRLQGHGLGKLPDLPSLPGEDASYPMNFPFSSEYFFQTPADCKSPWEAVAYEDGRLFYERSTSRLRYRKMFCWGRHPGGRRWCDYLARPGEGRYIEVQGGLTPTQLHGLTMPGESEWDFTQLIGITEVDTVSACDEDWRKARLSIEGSIDRVLSESDVYAVHDRLRALAIKPIEHALHAGSGWGALERNRRERTEGRGVPPSFAFSDATIGEPQLPWLELLRDGRLPEQAADDIPVSWMIQDEWLDLLQASLAREEHRNWTAYLHLGVMLYERGERDQAREAWETSRRLQPSPWAHRNLAAALVQEGKTGEALDELERAYQVYGRFPDRAFAEEYLRLLVERGENGKAWLVYESLPPEFAQGERLRIIVGSAALELDKDAYMERLFDTEFAVIREGETMIIDLWYRYHAKKLAAAQGTSLAPEWVEEAKKRFPPPAHLDFRLIGS